ncbi:HNH endonuclease [Rhodospirillales bacterium]|nr:HNH endonuclease [Rhodospirillales bacterium]
MSKNNENSVDTLRLILEKTDATYGSDNHHLSQLLISIAESVFNNGLILSKNGYTGTHGNDPKFRTLLSKLFCEGEIYKGDHALGSIYTISKQLNDAVHDKTITKGAGKYREQVIEKQGGAYCALCGSKSDLSVDHLIPVNRGGNEEWLGNMQLLCKTCNSSKSNHEDEILYRLIKQNTDCSVSPSAKFAFLLLKSIRKEELVIGKCDCGKLASDEELEVVPRDPNLAANFLNLKIRCDHCFNNER